MTAFGLTRGGLAAAAAVGTVTLVAGGGRAVAVLFAFFLTASALSRLGRTRKRAIGEIAKGGARDAWQVAANGGIATLCIAVAGCGGGPVWFAAFAGAYAAANADTWGTEIGMLVRHAPRSILTGRPLATGLSGGVTIAGTLAEFAGAAVVAAWTGPAFAAVALGGIAGAFADSLLGALLQAQRWCPACERACENDPHACGTASVHRRGVRWLGNDAVNLIATIVGAAVAATFTPR